MIKTTPIKQDDNKFVINNKSFMILKKFRSKKNQVYLVKDHNQELELFVLKIFSEEFKNNFLNEINTLKTLNSKSILVPKIVEHNNDYILLKYLNGYTILELINIKKPSLEITIDEIDQNIKNIDLNSIFKQMGNWLAELHLNTIDKNGKVILKGDCVLNNFIYVPESKKIFAVDFEESIKGDPIIDLGGVCASILTIKPIFTPDNFDNCERFIMGYNEWLTSNTKKEMDHSILMIDFSSTNLAATTRVALKSISKWRSEKSAQEILKWINQIRLSNSLRI